MKVQLLPLHEQVVVITGDDKGPEPRKVLRAIPKANKIVVEGVNLVYEHVKPSQRNQQGGRLSKEMPISVSNVMLYSQAAGRGVRVGVRVNEAGQKERYCKVTKTSLGTLGPAKPNRKSTTAPESVS